MTEEEVLELCCTATYEQNGFAVDIGGTLIKLALCRSDSETGVATVAFRSFPLSQLEEAMACIEEKYSDLLETDANIICCGVGIGDRKQKLYDTLKMRVQTASEMDCFVEAFTCLYENLPREKMLHAKSKKGRAYVERQSAEWREMITKSQRFIEKEEDSSKWKSSDTKLSEEVPSHAQGTYPVLLSMMGSGMGILRIDKGNKYELLDAGTRCGRCFLGLAGLLTGVKNFDDLILLAENGDSDNIHSLGKHVKPENNDDAYSVIPDHMPLYCYGQTVGKNLGDFSKEDLAAAVLSTISQDIAQAVLLRTLLHKIESVFFCGSFCGLCHVVLDEVSKYFMEKAALHPQIEFGFMKYGGYLGALGALLRTLKIKYDNSNL